MERGSKETRICREIVRKQSENSENREMSFSGKRKAEWKPQRKKKKQTEESRRDKKHTR